MKERANPTAKKVDFYLGVPLVRMLSLFKNRSEAPPREMRRIGLLKASSIGDTVLISPVVCDLCKAFPEAEVTLFTGSSNFRIAQLLLGEQIVRRLPMLQPWLAIREVRKAKVDVFIDCDSWPRVNALLSLLSGAQYTIGFRTRGQYRDYGYDIVVPHNWEIHELENLRNLVRPLGVSSNSSPAIEVPAATDNRSGQVVFHPWPGGSRANEKMWPLDRWVELARTVRDLGFKVGISTGPADIEKSTRLAALGEDGLLDVIQTRSLEDLLSLLASCALVVTVDTGVAHLAAALGQRTIVLHGPTTPRRWGAIGPRVLYLKDTQNPVINLGFEPAESSFTDVPLEEVVVAVRGIL